MFTRNYFRQADDAMEKILVIKLGALGDVITALGPMAAIRRHHPAAHITLLTTKAFAGIGRDCGYFDDVLIDRKPKIFDLKGWMELRQSFKDGNFSRVYDLQNNDRTALYLRLFSPRPEWVGAAPGASHRNTSPLRTQGRAYDGHIETLSLGGVHNIEPDTLDWMKADISRFSLTSPYVLLIPGSSPQHPKKRWPAEKYREAAQILIDQGYRVVLLGTKAEAPVNAQIADRMPVVNLTGQTELYDIAALGRNAAGAIGNDTGPAHMVSATGCPTIILYCSACSTLRKHGPIGKHAQGIEEADLAQISSESVVKRLQEMMKA